MISLQRTAVRVLALALALSSAALQAENRSFDGTGNHLQVPARGAANTPMLRVGYGSEFAGPDGEMISDPQRPNPRNISNDLFAQSASSPSARNLSDYVWAWGQFISHDTSLTTSSDGPLVNGVAPIAVNAPFDPLGPQPIPFTRANYVDLPPPRGSISGRTPINEVTSYIDASTVYGSDAARAAALRTEGGTGAKLLTSHGDLLPYNTMELPIENHGPFSNHELFLAGDIRSNENSLLTSLHTVFTREHNRLVDVIVTQQPDLAAEEQYQLARKLVGAQMQIITYREFLPALLGDGPSVPKAEDYHYSIQIDASVTTAFAHAGFRYGHSTISSQLQLVDDNGNSSGSIDLRDAFYNPEILGNTPEAVDHLLKGAATQVSEDVDLLMVDELRNFLFGPPGAGGLDLAAINIQRGRDVGLPDYRTLAARRGISINSFSDISSDPAIVQALEAIYDNNIHNVDAWVGMLAEDHVPGASVGRLVKAEIEQQFWRLRDGDRLFYLSNDAGLYANGILKPEIAAIIDLDKMRLSDVLLANTAITNLQQNVFFVPIDGDYDNDFVVDGHDFLAWQRGESPDPGSPMDLQRWQENFGIDSPPASFSTAVPEPNSLVVFLLAAVGTMGGFTRRSRPRKIGS